MIWFSIFCVDYTFIETDKKEKKDDNSNNLAPSKNEKNSELDSVMTSDHYRFPLVWIDLEMTGK